MIKETAKKVEITHRNKVQGRMYTEYNIVFHATILSIEIFFLVKDAGYVNEKQK